MNKNILELTEFEAEVMAGQAKKTIRNALFIAGITVMIYGTVVVLVVSR